MSVNLIHTILTADGSQNRDRVKRDWAAITAIADVDGIVWISDETVNAVATLVEDIRLTNGETVSAYPSDGEEFSQEPYVPGFGPSLLGEDALRNVRTALESDENGAKAVAMFDLIVERGLQISLSGKNHIGARLTAVNWPADEVEINRSGGNMAAMFRMLGLSLFNGDEESEASENVPLDVFAKAVNDNAFMTDMPDRLERFVACATRSGATHVYWA